VFPALRGRISPLCENCRKRWQDEPGGRSRQAHSECVVRVNQAHSECVVRVNKEKRSRKQEQFIAALLSHPTVEAAAEAVGIGDVTAWRWRKDPAFAERYREAAREVMSHTSARLQEATRVAVDCLREVTGNKDEPASSRVSAARTIWTWHLRRPTWRTYAGALTLSSRPPRRGQPNERQRLDVTAQVAFQTEAHLTAIAEENLLANRLKCQW
jgi:hypothetical protein